MLRHERACDAAKKTTKERRSFGLEEVHPGEPYGRPNSPQSPKNKQTASACLIGHIWGFVAASAAVVALPCIFRAFLRRRLTALLADRTGSASSASGLTRPRPCCHCPACQPACSGQNRSSVRSGSLGAVSIG